MGNPYESQAISGYNSSPPSDDGSETAANVVKWATHKTKLADPIKTLAEAINTQLVLAFGLTFGQGILSKSANYTVATSDRGSFLSVTGTSTITLPAAATAGDGFPLLIVNTGSAVVTVDGNSSETINGATSIVLWPNDYVVLTCDGSSWAAAGRYVETGSWTPNWSAGWGTPPSGDIIYAKRGMEVTIQVQTGSATSNSALMICDNVPAAITPAHNVLLPVAGLVDNGGQILGSVSIENDNTMKFRPENMSTGFTASGTKGFANTSGVDPTFTYTLRTQ